MIRESLSRIFINCSQFSTHLPGLLVSVTSLGLATILLLNLNLNPDWLLPASAADDLKLKKGISYVQDTDSGFPIEAEHMDDYKLETGKATVLFFGASGDLNTNRQAKRLVDLYKQAAGKPVKFILVDVDHANDDQAKTLLRNHYKGYIPFEVILDKSGKVSWSQIGEVENGTLSLQLDKALNN